MKKKVFITLLVLFISLAIFAQGGNEQTGRPTIDVLTWGGADRLGYLKTIYEETTDECRVYTGSDPSRPLYMGSDEAIARLGDRPVFRIILSPEDKGVDLTGFAIRFLRRSFFPAIGTDDVEWVAANHYNTDHPHTHILVSRIAGRASGGPVLRYRSAYVESGRVRRDASAILDSLMGPRTPEENRRIEREKAERFAFTDTDRIIEARADKEGPLLALSQEAVRHESRSVRASIRRRLSWLSRNTGSVWFDKDSGEWKLRRDWKDLLRIEEMSPLLGIAPDEKRRTVVDGRATVPYKGRVRKSIAVDDEPDRALFNIEGDDGSIHVISDRLSEDERPEDFEGRAVEVSFPLRKDGARQKKPRIVSRDGLIRTGRGR